MAIVLLVAFHYLRTFTITGTATTPSRPWAHSSCMNFGEQLAAGAAVTVYSSSNDIVGTGQLGQGVPTYNFRCEYPFTITGVRDGRSIYQIQIGNYNKVVFTRDQAEHPALVLKF